MKKQNTYAFTLVELVVVITILAILGTIGFLSISGYAQKARNSNRVYDMKVIEKALSVYIQTTSLYPNPDNAMAISYSGGIAWSQGIFGSGALSQVGRVSTIPVDPLTKTAYTYSVLNNRTKYQIGGITEGGLFSSTDDIISSSYALTSPDLIAHTLGNFMNNDVPVINGGNCSLISAPSIILSDIPAGGVLNNGSSYRYSYTDSLNIPSSYSGKVADTVSGINFQTVELLHSCSIETIGQLELYIAQLSTAYQSLSSLSRFQNLIFNSNTSAFELETISNLQNNGIHVAQSLIDELHAPLPQKVFTDIFTDTDGVFVVGGHTPNSASGSWLLLSGGAGSAYSITTNRLIKNGVSSSLIYPLPSPIISLPDYKVSFDIQNFSGGNIRSYLRYTDANNYYELILSASGYQVNRRLAGVNSIFQNISDPIALGSTISFSITGDTLVLTINGIEKENILAGGLSAVGNALLLLENNTASIDNYSLIYK